MSIYIHNAYILSFPRASGLLLGGIRVEGDTVTDVVPYGSKKEKEYLASAEEVVDASDMIVVPGMVNAHYHSYSNWLKGTESDLPLELWTLFTTAYGHAMDSEEIRLSVLLGAAEMMKNGITSCIDHFPHVLFSKAALEGYEASGMRVSFAPMMHDVPDHRFLPVTLPDGLRARLAGQQRVRSVKEMEAFYRDLIQHWHGKKGRIWIMLGPNAPQRCTNAMLELCRRLAAEEGLQVHTHLLETRVQREIGRRVFPGGLVRRLKELGLLHSRLSAAHAVWLDEDELRLLAESGAAVVHNPASNLLLGSGCAPLASFLSLGIPVSLGTDGSNCGGEHNLFQAMRLAVMGQRPFQSDETRWLRAEEVWHMATQGGAAVMGMAEQVGVIGPGRKADLVLIDTRSAAWTPFKDPISQLVFHENGRSVDSVMVGGKWTVRGGKVVAFDEGKLLRRVKERYPALLERWRDNLKIVREMEPCFRRMLRNVYRWKHETEEGERT